MTDETATPEREMLDRYEPHRRAGARGGMGSVHLARLAGAGGFQRLYAIKVMHPHLAEETEFVGMLLDEARIAARIHHPNAVPIVDVCHSSRGFYLVMDYIDGVTLARLLLATGALPWRAHQGGDPGDPRRARRASRRARAHRRRGQPPRHRAPRRLPAEHHGRRRRRRPHHGFRHRPGGLAHRRVAPGAHQGQAGVHVPGAGLGGPGRPAR
ncbi:MAG: protein kinase [Deltaproteobacteria bacterium]|nr:protein kinase [Deltaproteobacteria bacterium]